MKTINRLFAIAAIAGAAVFAAPPVSAAVASTTETTSDYDGYTFEMFYGSDWAQYDEMLVGNANRNEIVLTAVEMCWKSSARIITHDEYATLLKQLLDLGCPYKLALIICCYKMDYHG